VCLGSPTSRHMPASVRFFNRDIEVLIVGWLLRRIANNGRTETADPISDRAVARVVQQRIAAAGLDPKNFAGHSLRAGFLTAAARSGASIFQMQQHSRHKSVQVLSGYVRRARLFEGHAGEDFL
jgi:integrase